VIPEGHRAGSGAVIGDDDEHPVATGLNRGDDALELGRHVLLADAAQFKPHPRIRVDALVEAEVVAREWA
jgi:hypothetical protein